MGTGTLGITAGQKWRLIHYGAVVDISIQWRRHVQLVLQSNKTIYQQMMVKQERFIIII